MNKIIKVLVILPLTLLLFACGMTSTTSEYLDLDYSDFNGQFIEVTGEQLSMPETDYYIYYYGPSCGACNEIKPILLDRLYRAKSTTIYFVTVFSINDLHPDSGVNGTPTIIRVTDNQVAEFYEGATSILGMLDQIN